MPVVYRICKTKFMAQAFDGEGAFRFGGRWNSRGTRIIYMAGSLALAVLEMLVHLDDDSLLPKYSYVPAEIPPDLIIPVENYRALPKDWSASPAPLAIPHIGEERAREAGSVALEVPTSIVPLEKNYLLNPAHPDFAKIKLGAASRFVLDARWQGR